MTTMIVDVDVDVDAALSFVMQTLSDRHQIMKKTISADTASDSSDSNSLLLSFYDGEDYEASLSVSMSMSMSISISISMLSL
jgi:hypothetical protein